MFKWLKRAGFFVILFLFCYFRIIPILYQTVPYTFDQGRDFLKVEEIVRYKNPTFIGPTTGIMGVYHGAWWYYFLAISYIIFNGKPIGFYYFLFIFSLIQAIFLYKFLEKEFNFLSANLFLLLISGSSYFILNSFFPISSVFTFPFILLLFYSLYQFLKTKKKIFIFLIFLSLAFIFEAEVAEGVFFLPAFFLCLIITKHFKLFINKKTVKHVFLGLILPTIPRIAFELKNNFIQTKAAINFLRNSTPTNPVSLKGAFFDRLKICEGLLRGSIPIDNNHTFFMIIFFFFLIIIFGYKKLSKLKKDYFNFLTLLLLLIFGFSLFYKTNFFWTNYFEGLPYFYLLLVSIGFYGFSKYQSKKLKSLSLLILIFFIVILGQKLYKELIIKKPVFSTGLRVGIEIVDYLYEKNKNQKFCLRIYTPPVVPYTYNYLFSYYARTKSFPEPSSNFINGRCWYIIEDDSYKFRIEKWRRENIPSSAKKTKVKVFSGEIRVEEWQI